STGSFISQLRELEQIREMITSSTLATIVDLPFFFLFMIVLAIIQDRRAVDFHPADYRKRYYSQEASHPAPSAVLRQCCLPVRQSVA
ncbi:protein secretion ABC efflux system permease and ATP-binding protein, partial [Salmonella enterica subsp. enterica serovar Tallahassee str. 0012]